MSRAHTTTAPAPAKQRSTSFFEFWPSWVMYFPVGVQWLFLAARYRSLTLPFLANPNLSLSGMVGMPKSELMNQATGKCAQAILPWIDFQVDRRSAHEQAEACIQDAAEHGIQLPFVCKPDIGCRGVGVKLVAHKAQLTAIIQRYPAGATLLCQQLAVSEPEVGIFYVKNPQTGQSEIASMTLKILPRVTGDGVHTLGQLIEQDPRAGQLRHLYDERHKESWDRVPAPGAAVRLVFSASHSKGAIFIDARDHITPELTQAIAAIMQDLPEFYYGRLDVKFSDLAALKKGDTLEIIEINGASAESIHIWDKDTKLLDAIKALLWQYRTLFQIGAYHRAQGKKTPTVSDFLRGWKIERQLTQHYPLTD
jgi:hypothetical protein